MRRAYNRGDWENARKYAMRIIDDPKEEKFAKSVVLRSYWNQKDLSNLDVFLSKWPNDFHDIRTKFEKELDRLARKSKDIEIPSPSFTIDWNSSDICTNFIQDGNTLWLKTPNSWVHWIMPDGFDLNHTHPSLLQLATDLLLRPWNKEVKGPLDTGREKGVNYALSYSAGTDSSAAMQLMPKDTILGYHERNFTSMLKHDNAHRMINHLRENRDVLVVKSNHEHLRKLHGEQTGFSTSYAAGVHLVLLADFLDLRGIAYGTPIDNTWLAKGKTFRVFSDSSHLIYWKNRFAEAGLELILPINMISEAGAMKICKESSFIDFMNSCMRGNGITGCGKCWKCFHKNGPLGRKYDVESHEISTFLQKRPLRSGMHAVWAAKVMNIQHLLPDLESILDSDLSWWEQYYPPGLELIPNELREHVESKLKQYLEPMDAPYVMETINLFPE